MDVLSGIGNTPLVELKKIPDPGSARVLVKLEMANPTGSMKDRMALTAIEAAEKDGRLPPGGTVVEYTGGTTGVSLAFICAAKGYRIKIVFSDAFSPEKEQMMKAFGADVMIVPSKGQGITADLIKAMIAEANTLSEQPGHWWFDQLNNHDGFIGYHSLGEEIWQQTSGEVSGFVHGIGSAHSIHGVTEVLWQHDPGIQINAVEPAESAILAGHPSGAHGIDGIGIGFLPPLWDPNLVNEISAVSTAEAKAMARRLAQEEGIFAGTSSGANVVAALRLAEQLGPDKTVVTLMVDSGLRYLSTDVFAA